MIPARRETTLSKCSNFNQICITPSHKNRNFQKFFHAGPRTHRHTKKAKKTMKKSKKIEKNKKKPLKTIKKYEKNAH
jgi:hypothetical protein